MKRLFLRAATALLVMLLTSATAWAQDAISGLTYNTTGGYYEINDAQDLVDLANYVNGGNDAGGKTFKQTHDITMTGEHTPIGNALNISFRGTFDGNHQTITGLYINKPNDGYVGLFGCLTTGATVKDLTLADCDITGKYYVGGIVGRTMHGSVTIENCHVSGQNKATVEGANCHGGIVGEAKYTTITGCTVSGTLTGISGVDWGGILGYAGGDVNVTSCENAASITLTGSGTINGVGGITGSTTNTQIEFSNCLNRGTISAGNSHVGAISGTDLTDYTGFFTNCYYTPVNGLKAFGNNSNTSTDAAGHGEPVYAVTAGDNITSLSASPNAAITSTMSGTAYYKAGTYTLTLTPNVPANQEFVRYTCEGGTLDNGDVLLLQVADDTHTLIVSNADVTIGAIVGSPRVNITGDGFTLADIPEQRYRGVAIEPVITLQDGETTLVEGTDYLVVFTNNTAPAPADGADAPTATITGINGYKGTLTRTFTIADFPLQTPGSDNSADNPWLVASEEDLEALASLVNSDTRRGGYYKQTTDITMTHEHTAIGYYPRDFMGTYDGDNKAIRNLVINKPDASYQGLFGAVTSNGIIKNIVLENCDITGGDLTGGIAGKMAGKELSNCIVSGAIKVGEGLSADRHGGITGFSNKELNRCINSASVTGAGSKHGGICGETSPYNSQLHDNLNTGVVEGTSYVGSIVGFNQTPLSGISPAPYKNNYHTSNTTGSIGSEGSTTGTDVNNDDLVFEITAADGLTLTLPTPTYTWGNKSLFNRGTQVTISLTVPEGKYFDRYTVSNGTISNPFIIDGSHQLTNQTGDVVISASLFDGQANLATAASIADIAAQTYNGAAYRPLPVVTYDGRTLVKDLHYTVSYSEGCTNADTYTVTVTGMGSYSGQLTKDYVINPFDISTDDAVTVTGVDAEYKQTSYAIHPQPVVTCAALNNTTLVEGTDYDLSYSEGCTLPGDYNVILTGKGNYTGVKNVPFTILDEFIDLYVEGNVYTINTATGWNDFCDALQDLDTYNRFSGKTVKLGNDIEVSRMAGSDHHDFCGTFDGDGHTLTFNYGESGTPASDEYIAPFRYISNTKANTNDAADSPAKIMNLHVAGDIYTSAKFAAGIVAQHWGTLTIENCRSSIVIHSSVVNNDGNDGTHGGIEAVSRGVLNITGCVFDGKIVTTNGTTNCGGFVGWRDANANQTITNSLYAPAYDANTVSTGCYTFVRNPGDCTTITNCYYTRTLGTDQGQQARSITAGNFVTVANNGTVSNSYSTSGLTFYNAGFTYNNVLYAASGDQVSLSISNTMPANYVFSSYSVSPEGTTLTGSGSNYILTMPDEDVEITANFTINPATYLDANGDEQTCNNYTLLSGSETSLAAGWYVAEGNVSFDHQLNASGDVHIILKDNAVMNIGTAQSPVSGFGIYGNGHSISIYAQSKGDNKGQLLINASMYGIFAQGGNVGIYGGNVTATATDWGSEGIFAMKSGSNGGSITLKNATVTAEGTCAIQAKNGNLTAEDCTITATVTSSNYYSIWSTNTTLTNCEVTATGGSMGIFAEGGNVEISGGEVEATGTQYGIFANKSGSNGGSVSITNHATVTAEGGVFGIDAQGGSLTAEDCTIIATGTTGYGTRSTGGNTTLTNCKVTATGGYAGIYTESSRNIVISGGEVEAYNTNLTNGNSCGGIAAWYGSVSVTGATITAGGNYSVYATNDMVFDGSTVTASDVCFTPSGDLIIRNHSKVTSTASGPYSLDNDGGSISISDSEVDAIRVIYGKGGVTLTNATVNVDYNANSDAIHAVNNGLTIDGSTVTTTGHIYSEQCNLSISNSKVKATGSIIASNSNGNDLSISNSEVEFTNIIYTYGNLTIDGSIVKATGNGSGSIEAILGILTLGWSSPSNLIYAKSYGTYDGSIVIAEGKTFIDEDGNTYTGTMAKENDAYAINGKTLRPYTTETIAMNATGIRTYASEYDLDFTNVSGLTAYVATSISNNTLTLTRAGKVPGGTGLLLKGMANGNFSVHTTGSATAINNNLLVGLTEVTDVYQTTDDGIAFILANGDYGINWYKLAEEHYKLKANSAYLRLPESMAPTASRALTMVFKDDATGIVTMSDARSQKSDAWYTLDGVKLDKKPTRKGLYIFNGHKTVVK